MTFKITTRSAGAFPVPFLPGNSMTALAGSFASSFGKAIPGAAMIGAAGIIAPSSQFYSTNFPATENPISEGGAWTHLGTSWSAIRTTGGHAIGTQAGGGGTDDSYAHLSGFNPDITVDGTVWLSGTLTGNGNRELEILLRWADTSSTATGYECNFAITGPSSGGYQQIVRWNGAFNNFTILNQETSFPSGTWPPANGDIIRATISGNTITTYINKNGGLGFQQIGTTTDSTYTTGNPGIGQYIDFGADPTQFGFSSYTATSP